MSDAIQRLNAALKGRYEVEREIGEGGMATVFLAKDLKHNRNVALKVLKPESFRVTSVEPLFTLPERALIGSGTGSYDVTADDQRFVMALQVELGGDNAASTMVLVQNFGEELKARVPH